MAASKQKITLDRILDGQTLFPMALDDFEAFLTYKTKDVENLHFWQAVKEYARLYVEVSSLMTNAGIPGSSTAAFASGGVTVSAVAIASAIGTKKKIYDRMVALGNVPSGSPAPKALTEELRKTWGRAECQWICDTWLQQNQPETINIPGKINRELVDQIRDEQTDPSIFDASLKEVFKNMRENDLHKFLKFATTNIGDHERTRRLQGCLILMTMALIVNLVLIFTKVSARIRRV